MSGDPHAPGGEPRSEGEQVGSVPEEAARLLGALSDWGREHGPDLGRAAEGLDGLAGRASAAARELADHLGDSGATGSGSTDCAWCPVCRTAHLVRAASPEVRDHLASAAASLVQAGAAFLAAASAPAGGPAAGGSVEHIDLDTDDTGWPEEEPS